MQAVLDKKHWVWFSILILAALLRLWGIQFGLPHLYHADEPIVVNHALAYGAGDFHPHFFKIPPLVSYLLFICYGVFYVFGFLTQRFLELKDFENLFYQDPSSFYLIARIAFGFIPALLTVHSLYRLGEQHFSKWHGALAALILSVCFLHVRESHYIYVDICLVLAMVLAFRIFFRVSELTLTWKNHVLMGCVIGLATAFKYNGIFLVIPYLAISLFRQRMRHLPLMWFVSGASCIGSFVLLNPYALLDFDFFMSQVSEESTAHSGGIPVSYLLFEMGPSISGWFFYALGWLGCFWSLSHKCLKRQSMALFMLCYVLVLVIWGQPYGRYWLPLTPFFSFFIADFVLILKGKLKDGALAKGIFFSLLLLVIIPSLTRSFLWNQIMARDDSRTEALHWIEENIERNEQIALDGTFDMPRLRFSRAQLILKKIEAEKDVNFSEAKKRRVSFLLDQTSASDAAYDLYFLSKEEQPSPFLMASPNLPYDVKVLREQGLDYVVVVRRHEIEQEPLESFYAQLKEEGKLVASFNPYKDRQKEWPLMHPLTGGPYFFEDVLTRERNGLPISIYELT